MLPTQSLTLTEVMNLHFLPPTELAPSSQMFSRPVSA